jgi:cytosine/adenosine deaminase-related metal-dependent hydrolase
MLAAGINVCLGSDSLASNPDLSILNEIRFLHQEFPDLPSEELMAMGTIRGARGLGMADRTGSIDVGKAADLIVIPLESPHSNPRWDSLFDTNLVPSAVYVNGQRQI